MTKTKRVGSSLDGCPKCQQVKIDGAVVCLRFLHVLISSAARDVRPINLDYAEVLVSGALKALGGEAP